MERRQWRGGRDPCMFGRSTGGKRKRGGAAQATRQRVQELVDAWVGEGVARVAVGGERGGRGDGGVAVALQRSGNAFTERRQVELALWWRAGGPGAAESLLSLRHHVPPGGGPADAGAVLFERAARAGDTTESKERGVTAAAAANARLAADLQRAPQLPQRRVAGGGDGGDGVAGGDRGADSAGAEA